MGKYDSVGAGAAKGQRHYDEMALQWARLNQRRQAQNFEQQRAMAVDNDKRYQHAQDMKQRETEHKRETARLDRKAQLDNATAREKNRVDYQKSVQKNAVDLQKMASDIERHNREYNLKNREFAAKRDDEMARRMEWEIDNFRKDEDQRLRMEEFNFQVAEYNKALEQERTKKIQTEASMAALVNAAMMGGYDNGGRMFAPQYAVNMFNQLNPEMNLTGLSILTQDAQGRRLPQPQVAFWTKRFTPDGKEVLDEVGHPVINTTVLSPEQFAAMNERYFYNDDKYDSTAANFLPPEKEAVDMSKIAKEQHSRYKSLWGRANDIEKAYTRKNMLGEVEWVSPEAKAKVEGYRQKASNAFNEWENGGQGNGAVQQSQPSYDFSPTFVTGGEARNTAKTNRIRDYRKPLALQKTEFVVPTNYNQGEKRKRRQGSY